MFDFIGKRKYWFGLSTVLIIISLFGLFAWGLNLGIDFTGGSLIELQVINKSDIIATPSDTESNFQVQSTGGNLEITDITAGEVGEQQAVEAESVNTDAGEPNDTTAVATMTVKDFTAIIDEVLKDRQLTSYTTQPVNDSEVLIRLNTIDEETHQSILQAIKDKVASSNEQLTVEELRFESIGPVIGNELKQKSILAIFLVLLAIVSYIAFAFRKVSYPVASWKYGISAILALAHDIIIITGVFSYLGHFYDHQADILFVTALLTIMGFSVHDTIVTFDRTRENLYKDHDITFAQVVNKSINETIVRSLNTSITTTIVLVSVYLFGGASVKDFILALILGIIIGTYSSIFIASPLLVTWYKLRK